jgi:pimeloyl-[acyl-carrier protein] methyl ester esterase
MVTIVLLPGMDGTGSLFAEFVTALGKDFEVIVISYPTDLALDYLALEDIARKQLPVGRPFFLLGESFSGPIAISLAASKPDGLIGLLLICTFAKNPHPYFHPFKSLIRFLPTTSSLTNLISPVFFGPYSTAKLQSSLQQALRRVSSAAIHARLRAVLDVDYSVKLTKLNVPILYLRADHDCVVFPSASRHIVKVIPTATVVSLPGPHLLLQAMPVEAAHAIKKFIQQVSTARIRMD